MGLIGSLPWWARIAPESQAGGSQAQHMQQVSVWLVGPVQPGHSEMLFGCRFAHTGFHFYCLCTHPEHACSHHQSQALEKRVISAYHGSLAPGTSLHPARQAPSLEQPTNQLELASGEPGPAPTQPTKHTLRVLAISPKRMVQQLRRCRIQLEYPVRSDDNMKCEVEVRFDWSFTS